jgi:regulator of protease activity HflC (stomatin/prohibitin superfamily)
MSDATIAAGPPPDVYQLTQVVVPLNDAADAFARRDASGRIPLVVVPTRPFRLLNNLTIAGAVALGAGILADAIFLKSWTLIPFSGVAIALFALGAFRAFLVRVPEGAGALLARGGRYQRTVGSGTHIVPPWVTVSHLVTRREIPFDVLVSEAPTKDTVRVRLETLLTFTIDEPYRFVFNISTDDFDEVLQASSQEAMRALVRNVSVAAVLSLTEREMDDVRAAINPDVEPYGARIMKIKITFAQPPPDFLRTQEGQQLAILQRAEQAERQALAERRQADEDTLARQRLLARVQRARDELQIELERAEARQRLVELDAEAETLRLARLEQRLRDFPHAAQYDVESSRLDVARALAGNSRAVLQLGSADDISRVLLMHDALREAAALPATTAGADQAPNGAGSLSLDEPELPEHELETRADGVETDGP